MFDQDYAFMKDAVVGDLYKIKGPAVKGYVWLPMRQEELARNTKGPGLEVSDSELAEGLGISKRTVCDYRVKLMKLRLVEAKKVKGSKIAEIAVTRTFY
jgi:hypothetical protein